MKNLFVEPFTPILIFTAIIAIMFAGLAWVVITEQKAKNKRKQAENTRKQVRQTNYRDLQYKSSKN